MSKGKNLKVELVNALNTANTLNEELKKKQRELESLMQQNVCTERDKMIQALKAEMAESEKQQLEQHIKVQEEKFNQDIQDFSNRLSLLLHDMKDQQNKIQELTEQNKILIEESFAYQIKKDKESLDKLTKKANKLERSSSFKDKLFYEVYHSLLKWLNEINANMNSEEVQKKIDKELPEKMNEIKNFEIKLQEENKRSQVEAEFQNQQDLINRFKQQINQVKINRDQARKQEEELKTKQTKLQDLNNELEKKLKDVKEEIDNKNKLREKLKNSHKAKIEQLQEEMKKRQQLLNDEIEKQKIELKTKEVEYENSMKKIQDMEEKLKQEKESVTGLKKDQPAQLRAEEDEFQERQIEDLQNQLIEKSNNIDQLQKLVDHLKQQSKECQKENQKIEIYERTLRSVAKREQYIRDHLGSFFSELQRNRVQSKA